MQRHRDRQAGLVQSLRTALADHDSTALDIATDVLRHLAAIYDQL